MQRMFFTQWPSLRATGYLSLSAGSMPMEPQESTNLEPNWHSMRKRQMLELPQTGA